jgi:hypothetical protein
LTTASYETHRAIERTLYRYCTAIDTGDRETFAALFERGQWAFVSEPGSQPVLDWLEENIIFYDGQTHTKHQITNLVVDADEETGRATFQSYISLWQSVPGFSVQPIFYGRFNGTFERLDGAWWWKTHEVIQDLAGDMSRHVKNWSKVESTTTSAPVPGHS